jgi:hypothetical protein
VATLVAVRTGSELLGQDGSGLRSLSAILTARPARVCVLVPLSPIFEWETLVEHALAAQTRVWGGHSNLVVPVEQNFDLSGDELFWLLVKGFDPDLIALHLPSLADVEEIAHPVYQAHVNEIAAQLHAAGFDAQAQAHELERQREQPFLYSDVPDNLAEPLIRWVAPLHHDRNLRMSILDGTRPPTNGLTDVTKIREIPAAIHDVRTTTGPLSQLMLTNQVGRLLQTLKSELVQTRGVIVEEALITHEFEFRHRLWDALGDPRGVEYPYLLSAIGLMRRTSLDLVGGPIILVAGDGPQNFLLFHGLQRMRPNVFWLPNRSMEDDDFVRDLREALRRTARSEGDLRTPITVSSVHNDGSAEAAVAALGAAGNEFLGTQVLDWRSLIPRRASWVADARSQRSVPLLRSEGRTHELPTPTPVSISTLDDFSMHWMVDVEVRGSAPVRNPELGPTVGGSNWITSHDARISSIGCSYMGLSSFTVRGLGFENALARPELAPLPLIDQVRDALAAHGLGVRLSDKGAFAEKSAGLFGGVEGLAAALRDRPIRAMLDAYTDHDGPGMFLKDTRRSYLSFEEAKGVVGEHDLERVITVLYDAGVLERGHVLKCDHCRATSFYSLTEDQKFTCRRCRTTRRATRWNWLKSAPAVGDSTPEPEFRYALAEVVYQFLKHRGHIPLLAAHSYFVIGRGREQQPFDVAFELELTSGEEILSEYDIIASWGTDLWVGEATSSDRFEQNAAEQSLRFSRLKDFADKLSARGLLFVTEAAGFTEQTKTHVTDVFEQRHPRQLVEILEGFHSR